MTTIVLARQLEAAGINDLSARAWDEAAKSWDRLRAFPVVAIRHADEARVNKAKVTAAWKDALGFILRKPGSGPLTQAVRAFVEVLPPQTPPNAGDKDQGLRAQYVFPLIPAAVDTDSARAVLDGLDLSYQKLGAQAALAYGLAKHNRDAEALDLLRTFPDYFLGKQAKLPVTIPGGDAPLLTVHVEGVFDLLAGRGHASELRSFVQRLPPDSEVRWAAERGLKEHAQNPSSRSETTPGNSALLERGTALSRAHRYRDARLLAEQPSTPEAERWQVFEEILKELSAGHR